MPKPHRNSQKRIKAQKAFYFVTTKTDKNYAYFLDDAYCELFVEELKLAEKLKDFKIKGYKVNPDHVHLLLWIGEKHTLSKVMQAIKRNFSQDINKLLGHEPEGGKSISRLHKVDLKKYKAKIMPDPLRFYWQHSFHDHIIRNRKDYLAHVRYIHDQWIRHELEENKFCYVGAMPFIKEERG